MWLKPTIVVLFIAILVSLATSAAFLLLDKGNAARTRKALGIRVTLAVILMGCVTYGVWTGQLAVNAPWSQ